MEATTMGMHLPAERLDFVVTRHSRGWNVALDEQLPVSFSDREAALDAAFNGARLIWEDFHLSSGVRVQDDRGRGYRVLRTYGG
jgi:hypothetical protein